MTGPTHWVTDALPARSSMDTVTADGPCGSLATIGSWANQINPDPVSDTVISRPLNWRLGRRVNSEVVRVSNVIPIEMGRVGMDPIEDVGGDVSTIQESSEDDPEFPAASIN